MKPWARAGAAVPAMKTRVRVPGSSRRPARARMRSHRMTSVIARPPQDREGGRLASIDALRGLIMVIMALDHVSFMVGRFHSAEMWAGLWTRYESPLAFLTRFITHLCAPGFFFLMGVGISLMAEN